LAALSLFCRQAIWAAIHAPPPSATISPWQVPSCSLLGLHDSCISVALMAFSFGFQYAKLHRNPSPSIPDRHRISPCSIPTPLAVFHLSLSLSPMRTQAFRLPLQQPSCPRRCFAMALSAPTLLSSRIRAPDAAAPSFPLLLDVTYCPGSNPCFSSAGCPPLPVCSSRPSPPHFLSRRPFVLQIPGPEPPSPRP
jgi:hypothetical protein